MTRLSVLGVPSSAGSYAAGQERAPAALRAAGLIEALREAGLDVEDAGDLPEQVWHPDREHPLAQNVEQVVDCLRELADRVEPAVARDGNVLVLGGNCTVALGVMAALQRANSAPPGLLYLDRQYDLNTPQSTTDGALDWMGLAHAFALPGCVDAVAGAFGPPPLLRPDQVAWLGVDDGLATAWERGQASRLDLRVASSAELAADPDGVAVSALGCLPAGPLAVHLDVDVLDFTDAPLAENTDGRNTGPTLDEAALALRTAARDPRFRALSVGELNPTRSAGDPLAIPRFVRVLADVLGQAAAATRTVA